MSKNLVKIISVIILFIIFIGGFSKSYTSHNISNLAYVLALGIDKGDDAKLKLTAQFSKSSTFANGGGSSDEAKNIVLISAKADSIFSALNLLNSYIGREINLAHCSVVVFSKDFAKERYFY